MARNKRDERDETKEIHVAEVVRHGTKVILPEDMTTEDAIDFLERVQEQEEEEINMSEAIHVFPWDGALALKKALEQMFGVALQRRGFFGAQQISVESGVGKTVQVPWGSFDLPGIDDGTVRCSTSVVDGRLIFEINAEIKRKHEPQIQKLIDLTKKIAKKESIYRGQAIRMKFRDAKGNVDTGAQPKFIDLHSVDPAIFSDDLQREIDANIMTLILYPDQVRSGGTPLKRSVLLAGTHGVGKTLLSANIAKVAAEQGWTFLYVEDVREMPDAVQFAMGYQPCVIFAEDIDRVTSGPRSTQLDEILNSIDGIGTKGAEVLIIMTTNAPGSINEAMRRPGRIDVPLFVDPPDPSAVVRLIHHYGRELIAPNEDLVAVGELLQGRIPAVIREVVERSKLETLRRTEGRGGQINAEDLLNAAKTYIKAEGRLRHREESVEHDAMRAFGEGFGKVFSNSLAQYLQRPVSSENGSGNGSMLPLPGTTGAQETAND